MEMTVKELAERLNALLERSPNCADQPVVIPVYRVGSIGPTPVVPIKGICQGFDWDKGKVFITFGPSLREIDESEIQSMRHKYEEAAMTRWEHSKKLKDDQGKTE